MPDLANIHCQEVDGIKVLQLETAAGAAIKVFNFVLDIFVTLVPLFRDSLPI